MTCQRVSTGSFWSSHLPQPAKISLVSRKKWRKFVRNSFHTPQILLLSSPSLSPDLFLFRNVKTFVVSFSVDSGFCRHWEDYVIDFQIIDLIMKTFAPINLLRQICYDDDTIFKKLSWWYLCVFQIRINWSYLIPWLVILFSSECQKKNTYSVKNIKKFRANWIHFMMIRSMWLSHFESKSMNRFYQ